LIAEDVFAVSGATSEKSDLGVLDENWESPNSSAYSLTDTILNVST